MVDQDGYRKNVGIVLLSPHNKVFWGRRIGEMSWQFPQGGIQSNEKVEEAMYRELDEELGLSPHHVEIIARTEDWLYYDVPGSFTRSSGSSFYRGQKQIWYLLKFVGRDFNINIKKHREPEFDAWRWIDYWTPIDQVVRFKRDVYDKALSELFRLGKLNV